jgi:hypothetical protein
MGQMDWFVWAVMNVRPNRDSRAISMIIFFIRLIRFFDIKGYGV